MMAITVMEGATVPLSQPTESSVKRRVCRRGEGYRLIAVLQDGGDAPDDQDDHHPGGDLHDPQGLLAGFVHAHDVLAPEVDGDGGGEDRGEIRRVDVQSGLMQVLADLVDESAEVEARADSGDGAGQHVIEHQGGDGELGQRPAHGLVDHLVDAAAHEHRAALDVDGAHRSTRTA